LILREFYEAAQEGIQDVKDDNSRLTWGSSRKTKKLTLGMISKLRKMRDVRAFEQAKNLKQIRKQYAPPSQGSGL